MDSKENCIEFIRGSDTATAFFTQGRFISKMKKLAKESDEIEVIENKDGSVLCHFPTRWVKISKPRQMTEEQRMAASERLRKLRAEQTS